MEYVIHVHAVTGTRPNFSCTKYGGYIRAASQIGQMFIPLQSIQQFWLQMTSFHSKKRKKKIKEENSKFWRAGLRRQNTFLPYCIWKVNDRWRRSFWGKQSICFYDSPSNYLILTNVKLNILVVWDIWQWKVVCHWFKIIVFIFSTVHSSSEHFYLFI